MYSYIIFIVCFNTAASQSGHSYENCTIGIAAGKATSDGRPLIWKTTDGTPCDITIIYNNESNYGFIGNTPAMKSGYTFFGLNEKGLAIVESDALDLKGNTMVNGNFFFIWQALGACATVKEFESLLNRTNDTGRLTYANYAIIDAAGAAVLFETADTKYWKFNVNDTNVAPNGYLIRANFSVNGGGANGIERFNRSSKLIADFHAGYSLNYRSILRYHIRDFSDFSSTAIPVPYPGYWSSGIPFGYVDVSVSICNRKTYTGAPRRRAHHHQ